MTDAEVMMVLWACTNALLMTISLGVWAIAGQLRRRP
jgi:hypothetical protein